MKPKVILVGVEPKDLIRPKGAIMVACDACPTGPDGERWNFFVDALDPRLPEGPFICESCLGTSPTEKRSTGDG